MKLFKYNESQLKYEPFSSTSIFLKFAILFFGTFLFLGLANAPIVEYVVNTEDILLVETANEFSEDKLIKNIKKLNFKHPHIVLAQSILETGHYGSKIFKENHNLLC